MSIKFYRGSYDKYAALDPETESFYYVTTDEGDVDLYLGKDKLSHSSEVSKLADSAEKLAAASTWKKLVSALPDVSAASADTIYILPDGTEYILNEQSESFIVWTPATSKSNLNYGNLRALSKEVTLEALLWSSSVNDPTTWMTTIYFDGDLLNPRPIIDLVSKDNEEEVRLFSHITHAEVDTYNQVIYFYCTEEPTIDLHLVIQNYTYTNADAWAVDEITDDEIDALVTSASETVFGG